MAIYTRKGDKGTTSLLGSRVDKDSLRIEAIGALDELNSFLGIVGSFCQDARVVMQIKEIQRNLFAIGSILAGAKTAFPKSRIRKVESEIDKLEGTLPVLKNFILPGGTHLSSFVQYSRALARRAERKIVVLSKEQKVGNQILAYMNRLSDCLFMLARKTNFDQKFKEEIWSK